jgi:PIN domain nuclease of toxin-antitoxin system
VWWASSPSTLSTKARQAARAAARRRELVASAISIFEIVTAERRGRLEFGVPIEDWLAALRQLPELTIHPVTDEVAQMAGRFDDTVPGDPVDRLIASTAIVLDAPLITADNRLRGTPRVNTIW